MRPSPTSYNAVAKLLHWSTAILVLGNLALGLHMEHFPGYKHGTPEWNAILYYHAPFGALVFWLTLFRFGWSATHQSPSLPSMPLWQKAAATAVHGLLYSVMILLPLTGYFHRLSGGHAVNFFSFFAWPSLLGKNEPFRVLTGNVHIILAFTILALVIIHLLAVVKHKFINRDNLLSRMSLLK